MTEEKPRCVKCGKLFDFVVGSTIYAHFPDTEFEGICKECNGDLNET